MNNTPPKTPIAWAAHRAKLNTKIARDCIAAEKEPPAGVSRMEYALFCLIHAVEELAEIERMKEERLTNPNK
jgi:hypothetical protein